MQQVTCYLGMGESREGEEYPCVLLTTGSGRDWKLSGRDRLAKVLSLIEQGGGDPKKIRVQNPKTKHGVKVKSLAEADTWLKRDKTESSGSRGLPKGFTAA